MSFIVVSDEAVLHAAYEPFCTAVKDNFINITVTASTKEYIIWGHFFDWGLCLSTDGRLVTPLVYAKSM